MKEYFVTKNKNHDFVIIRYNNTKWCALEVSLDSQDSKQRLSICGSTGYLSRTSNSRDDVYRIITINGKGIHLIIESCGQIREDLDKWFPEWKKHFKWHLNDMNAGCIHQRELGWMPCRGYHNTEKNEVCEQNPKEFPRYPIMKNGQLEYYTWDKKPIDLMAAKQTKKILPNTHQQFFCWKDCVGIACPVCGYKYGTQWLYEPLPQETTEWYRELNRRINNGD